jgi:hypothetical protein
MIVPFPFFWNVTVTVDSSPKVYFAALEQPILFTQELRACFRSLR